MASRYAYPAVLLALGLAALAGRSLLERVESPATAPRQAAPDRPEYSMEGLHTRRYDDNGRVARDLTAQRLDHYADARGSLLAEPRLSAEGRSGEPWRLSARQGQAPTGEERILLREDVRIDRAGGSHNQGLRLRTSELLVLPEKNYAETAAAVSIAAKGMHTTGTGLKAWLDTERLQILNDVEAQYEPKPRRKPARP